MRWQQNLSNINETQTEFECQTLHLAFQETAISNAYTVT
jgi:hypothetical protein